MIFKLENIYVCINKRTTHIHLYMNVRNLFRFIERITVHENIVEMHCRLE